MNNQPNPYPSYNNDNYYVPQSRVNKSYHYPNTLQSCFYQSYNYPYLNGLNQSKQYPSELQYSPLNSGYYKPQYIPYQTMQRTYQSFYPTNSVHIYETNIKDSAYNLIKQFIEQYNGTEFSKAISLGDLQKFRNAIDSVKIVVDPSIAGKDLALYDPNTLTIKVIEDPANVSFHNSGYNLAESLWHETVHRIEDINGDFGRIPNPDYDERNVEYMAEIIKNALSILNIMEKQKDTLSKEQLKTRWNAFLTAEANALKGKKYPVDINVLKKWFGFDVDSNKIKNIYEQGRPSEKFKDIFAAVTPSRTETLTVPNTEPTKVSTSFATKVGAIYTIEASGFVSDWSGKTDGVDAVWCYAKWRCGENGEPWQQLRIDDKGMMEISGSHIPYNPAHIYRIEIPGTGAPFVFYMADAQTSASDNSGSIQVTVTEKQVA